MGPSSPYALPKYWAQLSEYHRTNNTNTLKESHSNRLNEYQKREVYTNNDRTKIIKVKNVDACIAIRLSEIAKQNGYQNREDYLRDLFKKIAFDEFQLESESRYRAFTMEAIETMHMGTEFLLKELYEVTRFAIKNKIEEGKVQDKDE